MGLRNYQVECLNEIRRADMDGCRKVVVVLPCGTGKTAIASNVPEAIGLAPWEVMAFLVSSNELCFQAMEDLQKTNPSLRVALEKAEYYADIDADLVVASVDTLAASPERLARFAQLPLRIVFVDECHGVISAKWIKVLKALRVLKGEEDCAPERLLVGLTATPRRHDGQALERVFDRIAFRRTIQEMITAGWVAPQIAYRVETDINLDDIKQRDGDFALGELSRKVNTPTLNALVVKKYLEYGAGLPAIAFTVDIEHSEDLAKTFRYHGLDFEAISSNTPKARRRDLVEAHRRMELTGLISCQALATGFNSPPATVALWDRPTCSSVFYIQGVGRVGRPYPAPEAAATHTGYRKAHAILVDFVGTSSKHRLYTAGTLYGLNPQFDFKGRSIPDTLADVEALQQRNPTLDISAFAGLDDMKAAAVRVDLWKPAPIPKLAKHCSQFVWMAAGPDTYRLSAPGMAVIIEQNHLGEFEVSRHLDGVAPDRQEKFVQPEDSFAYADSLVPDEAVKLIRANARWRKDPPKQAQCELLWKWDPTIRRQFTDGEAFYRFADHQFGAGNSSFAKGAISSRIDIAKQAKERRAAVCQ